MLKRPHVERVITHNQRTALQIALDAQPEAMRVIFKELKNPNAKIRLDAAKYLTKNVLEQKIDISGVVNINANILQMTTDEALNYLKDVTQQ